MSEWVSTFSEKKKYKKKYRTWANTGEDKYNKKRDYENISKLPTGGIEKNLPTTCHHPPNQQYIPIYASSKRRKKYNILRVLTTHPGVFGYNAAANQRIFMSLMKIEVCQTTKSVSGKIQVQWEDFNFFWEKKYSCIFFSRLVKKKYNFF